MITLSLGQTNFFKIHCCFAFTTFFSINAVIVYSVLCYSLSKGIELHIYNVFKSKLKNEELYKCKERF